MGAPFAERANVSRLRQIIKHTAEGKLTGDVRLPQPKMRRREKAFRVEPQVLVDNRASDIHTLIEINGRDRPGLLYQLTAALSAQRLTIASAHISTYGERAVDVFYVKDRAGFKITNESAIESIKEALFNALNADQSAPPAEAAE